MSAARTRRVPAAVIVIEDGDAFLVTDEEEAALAPRLGAAPVSLYEARWCQSKMCGCHGIWA
jgi:hypothetical protein